MSVNFYYYDAQMRNYLIQFCNIFVGMKVKTGKGTCAEDEYITVPIAIGSKDRVVAAIQAGNTQNKPYSLPQMAAEMVGIDRNPQRKGVGVVDRRVYLPEGGVFPDDLTTAIRVMPIPYIMTLELSIFASNRDQMHQISEQILMLFDPSIQIQTNDSAFDWTKITQVTHTGTNIEENYPAGADRRMIIWTLTFDMPIWIAAPMNIKQELVREIFIRLGNLNSLQINEYDDEGNLVPFAPGGLYATIEVPEP